VLTIIVPEHLGVMVLPQAPTAENDKSIEVFARLGSELSSLTVLTEPPVF
jgi:hypothetical protein